MALERSELELIKQGFASGEKGMADINKRLDERRQTEKTLFKKLEKTDDKLAAVSKEVVHAQATADDADEHAVTAQGAIKDHVQDHKKTFWLFVKWGMGVASAVVIALLLAWLGLK